MTCKMGMESDPRYELAADAQRRAILCVLEPTGPPVALSDLARQVAAHETDSTPETVAGLPRVQRIYVSLYHVHIPKLADANVVSFDADRQTVTAGSEFDAVCSLMEKHGETLTGTYV